MPRLPDLDSLGPRPTPQGGRPISSIEGGFVARAMQQGAAEMGEMVRKMEAEDDTVAISAARRALNDWERDAVYDPEKGAASKQGSQAFGVNKELQESFDKKSEEISKGLKGSRQQQLFTEIANSRRAQVLEWADKHVLREREVFHLGEFKANVGSAIERASMKAATAKTPEEMATAQGEIALMQRSIMDFYRSKGRPSEERDQAISSATSDAHAGILRTLLTSGRTQEADAYYKTHLKAIDEKDRANLVGEINRRATEVEALKTSNEIWTEVGPKSLTEAVKIKGMIDIAQTKYANDPDRLKATTALLKEKAATHNLEQGEVVAELTNKVNDSLNKKVPLSKIMQTQEWKALPGATQAVFIRNEESRQESAMAKADRAEARADRNEARADRMRDRATHAAYFEYSRPEVLNAMSENQVRALAPVLGVDRATRLLDQKKDMAKAGGMAAATIDDDMFKKIAKKAGFKDVYESSPSEANKEILGSLKDSVEARIHTDQKRLGRPLERDEKQKVMQEVIDDKVMTPKTWWFGDPGTKPAALLTEEERKTGYVMAGNVRVDLATIPDDFAKAMADARTTAKLPPLSAAAMAEKWLTYKAKQKPGGSW